MFDFNPNAPARRPPRVVVAMPSTGRVHHASMESVRAMIHATEMADEVAFWWDNDQPHDRCRNAILTRFVNTPEWTHLLFLDTDVSVAPDTIDRLLEFDTPVVCVPVPCLHRRYSQPGAPLASTVGTNIMVFDDATLRGGIVEPERPDAGYRAVDPDGFPDHPFACDSTGLGLCLIKREVIERIDPPWCRFTGQFKGEYVGEDVYFFRKVRAAGFEILVDPSVTCDHHKYLDLTHLDLLYADVPPVSPWPRNREPNNSRNVFVAIRVPRTGWLDVRLLNVLREWEQVYGDRISIDRIFADSVRGAFAAVAQRVETLDDSFTHVLVLGDDVLPHVMTLGLLAVVEGPIVSALSRRFFDGKICWSYTHTNPSTGQLESPQNIDLPGMTEPFEVDSIDPACVLIKRDALEHAPASLRGDDVGLDADSNFMSRWCNTVAEATGRRPIQVPLTVERRAEVGLAGMLQLKMKLKSKLRAELQTA